jgi:hypothetical protein
VRLLRRELSFRNAKKSYESLTRTFVGRPGHSRPCTVKLPSLSSRSSRGAYFELRFGKVPRIRGPQERRSEHRASCVGKCTRNGFSSRFLGPTSFLVAHDGTHQETDVRGTLGDSPHQVGIPSGPEGDVNPNPVPGPSQLLLQLPSYSVNQLDLEPLQARPFSLGGASGMSDEFRIVSCDGGVIPSLEEPVGHESVLLIDLSFSLKRDLGRFGVSTLNQPDPRRHIRQTLEIDGRAPQIGLDRKSEVVEIAAH